MRRERGNQSDWPGNKWGEAEEERSCSLILVFLILFFIFDKFQKNPLE